MTSIRYGLWSAALALAIGSAACGSSQSATTGPAGTKTDTPTTTTPSYDAVPLIPREVLFGNPTKVSPALSPDGTRLAYLAPDDGVLNIWVKTVGQDDDRVVTADRIRGIRSFFWAPNGTQLIYIQDKGGDENWHVWVIPAEGGDAKDLTPIDGVNAQIVAVEPTSPDKILVGLNDRNPQLHDVYAIDLASGQRELVAQNDIFAIQWLADHDLQVRAAVALSMDGGARMMYRAKASDEWKELVKWGADDMFTTGPAGFTGDNKKLLMMTSVGSNTTELRTFDIATGAEAVIASHDTADVSGMVVHPTTHAIQAVKFETDRTEWKVIDPSIDADLAALRKLNDGELEIASRDLADDDWLVAFVQDDGPVVYYAWDRATQKETFLFSHRPELEDVTLAEMKPVSYQARDGLTIHGYLTLPPNVDAKALPTVVMPHGGPWARDSWGFDPMAQWLANRGYAVLQPNFRGSTGYGKDFLNAANKEWGGKMQDDVTDGTQWLIDQGISDASRICIAGGSYGGYATLMGLVREPDLYACGVDIVGVANLITWMKTIPPYWQPFAHVLHQRVGNPETEREFLESRSPVFLVDKIADPLLIGQGANDPRVPRDESIQMRDALQKAGKTVEYIEFADEGHGFARPENRLEFFRLMEAFLAEHIGGRVEK